MNCLLGSQCNWDSFPQCLRLFHDQANPTIGITICVFHLHGSIRPKSSYSIGRSRRERRRNYHAESVEQRKWWKTRKVWTEKHKNFSQQGHGPRLVVLREPFSCYISIAGWLFDQIRRNQSTFKPGTSFWTILSRQLTIRMQESLIVFVDIRKK